MGVEVNFAVFLCYLLALVPKLAESEGAANTRSKTVRGNPPWPSQKDTHALGEGRGPWPF